MSTTKRSSLRRLMVIPAVALLVPAALSACGDNDDNADDAVDDAAAPVSTEAGGGGDASGAAAVDIVSVSDGFDPATITVDVGTEVVWTNIDGASHTTTADDGAWDSGNLGQGESFTFAASEEGVFGYFCAIHPSMVGEIIVE